MAQRAMSRTRPSIGAVRVLMSGVMGVLALGACSSDDATNSTTTRAPATATSDAATSTSSALLPGFETFTGTDAEFYLPPDPLPPGPPGALIRILPLGDGDGVTTVKVMYHSTDVAGRDRAVTGVVTYPAGEPPAGGWPIIATAPGTTGIAAHCGISHSIGEAPSWGVQGVRVITDYIGLGVEGGPPHPYLSKVSEGNSVIDAVRAARQLPEAHASARWLSIGHSQGGHAALSAHELSSARAPELELIGTLALAPGAMLDRVYGGIDPIVTSILTAMSLYGGAGERPEVRPEDFVTPELAAASEVFETGCLDEITDRLVPLALEEKLFVVDPRRVEPTKSMVAESEVGDTPMEAPLFLVSGTRDDRVVIERVRDLYARLCAAGQVTELWIIEGADHGTVLGQSAERTASWLQDRIDGAPATDSCDSAAPTSG